MPAKRELNFRSLESSTKLDILFSRKFCRTLSLLSAHYTFENVAILRVQWH